MANNFAAVDNVGSIFSGIVNGPITGRDIADNLSRNLSRLLRSVPNWGSEMFLHGATEEVNGVYFRFPIPFTFVKLSCSIELTKLKLGRLQLPVKVLFGNSNSLGASLFGFGFETSRRTPRGSLHTEYRDMWRVDPGVLNPVHPKPNEWDAWADRPFHYHATKLFP